MCRASKNSVKSIVPLVMVVFRELVVVVMAIFKVGKDDVGYSGDCDCAGDCDVMVLLIVDIVDQCWSWQR